MVVRIPDPELDQLLRALADTTRRDILRRTVAGGLTVSELAASYDMSFAAVQKHVAVLEAAELVTKTRAGRTRLVQAEPDPLGRARFALQQLEALWHHRLTQLDAVLADTEE
jgi:DNA-binding transcriptional ArsR family regulator